MHLWYTGINSGQQGYQLQCDPQIQAEIAENNEDPAIWRGLFLWNSAAFHLSGSLLTPIYRIRQPKQREIPLYCGVIVCKNLDHFP